MSEPTPIPVSWSGTTRPASGLSVTVRTADSTDRSPVQAETSGLSRSRASRADALRTAARRLVGAARSFLRETMDPGPVLRADRGRWAGASSLAEIGELTAQWLTGQLASQPGYYGPVDVDEDLAPGLTAALVAFNRAGAVTHGSQGGVLDGEYVQIAWVDAFVDEVLLARLQHAAADTGYQVITHEPDGYWLPVTWEHGEASTSTGWLSPRDVAWLYAGVGRAALRQMKTALQVAVIDPVPGRNTMWAWLEQALAAHAAPRPAGAVGGRS